MTRRMDEELKKTIQSLFSGQKLGVLATLKKGQPYPNLVAFAASNDLKRIIFATPVYTRKTSNIEVCDKVSILIDNRKNRPSDFHEGVAVTALGTAEEIKADELEKFRALYLEKHPYMEDFVSSPTSTLYRIEVATYIVVTEFQKVMEHHFGK